MRKKKNNPLDDFTSAMAGLGYDNAEQHESITDMDEMTEGFSNVDTQNDDEPDPVKETEENEVDKKDPREDTTPIPDDVLKKINNQSSEETTVVEEQEEEEETNPAEAQQIGAFFDAFAESLGWDVTDDERPDSIESLIGYIGDVVEQNSTPQYADQRIAELDSYVKNGGRFEDFYNSRSQVESYDNLDMEDESNQKAVVRDYMKMQGYTDEQISRKIERYEDADMLEDEAADAVGYLKRVREQQLQQALAEQEQLRAAQEQQAMEFVNNLNSSIANLDNIRGIAIPKEDRKALYDYITKTDANGLTQYQKDFNENMVNNLIESAYFTMKGDSLIGSATRNGQTSAASKLRTMLRHQTKNHSSYNVQEEKAAPVWETASRFLGGGLN